ncbi:6-phosphogluconolactonase [uncultured Tessaracoccus sp.]|uniref:6-phosphogluconolactonase n=1 Tax=uncultured Tessaracoccus sp. TaxID=905023 RepID=UPI0025D432A1|nr:6-phosphogluconolactonase [uncultured Tessaracoccus sp.]
MIRRIVRLPTAADVTDLVAQRLVHKLEERQQQQDRVDVCLAGGNAANAVYERVADLVVDADIDFAKLHVWWGDERFVAATDPERNSLQAVERLARTIPMNSANIHMMAARDGRKDSHESAEVYENELGDTRFDLVLLGIGPDGHTASIFPGHPSFSSTSRLVIGVEDAPKFPPERITLTFHALNRTDHVWFLATGRSKAEAVAAASSGDLSMPAAHAHGDVSTVWFIDEEAAEALPAQYHCEL